MFCEYRKKLRASCYQYFTKLCVQHFINLSSYLYMAAYKILRGSYDNNVLKNILITKDTSSVRHSQRGHQFMLQTQSYKTRFRKNYLVFVLQILGIIYLNMWWRQQV